MKKVLTLLLAALLVFSGVSAFAEGWEIVVVPKDASNPWFVRMEVGVNESVSYTHLTLPTKA